MPQAGEYHGHAGIIGGGNDFLVADRTSGLDHRAGSGLDGRQKTVGEREEGVRGDNRSGRTSRFAGPD